MNSLGYIFSPTGKQEKEGFPDPKKMIGLLEDIDQGMAFWGKGEFQKAIETFNTIIKKYPNDVDAYTILGHIYADYFLTYIQVYLLN